ncbi:MAG: AAA family ATPase [Bacteroidota bacterium]
MSGLTNGHADAADMTTSDRALPERAFKLVNGQQVLDWQHLNPDIEHIGRKITLPADPAKMPIDAAIAALQQRKRDDEQVLTVQEIVDAYPLDGGVAFLLALQREYGWASPIPTPGFWPTPPQMITVDVGPKPEDKIQIPWGTFKVPNVERPITTGTTWTEFGPAFVISGTVRRKDADVVKRIADLTRAIVKEQSIYRGKAIRLSMNSDGNLDVNVPPKFIDTSHIKPDELVLSDHLMSMVETNIFTPIKRTKECLAHNIPLKRGVLLEGSYGCGKTLISAITSKIAPENGWTFIMLDRAQSLRQAIEFAKRYEPAVVFAEDIDRITSVRDEQANDLLNIMDGLLSKHSKVMVVLTTNHVSKINQAQLRPGRFDAVISITPPDAVAAERLIRMYARGLIGESVSLSKIGAALAQAKAIPAVIREVVERAKLAMVARRGSFLDESDLEVSASSMQGHLALLEKAEPQRLTPEQQIGEGIANLLRETAVGSLVGFEAIAQMLKQYILKTHDATVEGLDSVSNQLRNLQGAIISLEEDVARLKAA